jgi:hypothetical protein
MAVGGKVSGADTLDEVPVALKTLSLACYSDQATLDDSALDEALAVARKMHKRISWEYSWPARRLAALKQAGLPGVGAWAR